ncbi:MAG: TatD family hydrolase [Fibrobacterales bacterium]
MYIDTHCHIDSIIDKMNLDNGELITDISPETVLKHYTTLKELFPPEYEGAINVSCETATLDFGLSIIQSCPEVFGALGIHPHDAKEYTDAIHEKLIAAMALQKVVAWGEMGLDYHYDFSPREIQQEVFVRQLSAAASLNKPILIHTREAEEDTLRILNEHLPDIIPTHIHCYTGDISFMKKLDGLNKKLFFGFTGVITFKNSQSIREALEWLPLDQILLETDGPYMAPIPFRGKKAHPGMIPHIASMIAEVKNISLESVYTACRENTRVMYGI